jgi:hypothetical protein
MLELLLIRRRGELFAGRSKRRSRKCFKVENNGVPEVKTEFNFFNFEGEANKFWFNVAHETSGGDKNRRSISSSFAQKCY